MQCTVSYLILSVLLKDIRTQEVKKPKDFITNKLCKVKIRDKGFVISLKVFIFAAHN